MRAEPSYVSVLGAGELVNRWSKERVIVSVVLFYFGVSVLLILEEEGKSSHYSHSVWWLIFFLFRGKGSWQTTEEIQQNQSIPQWGAGPWLQWPTFPRNTRGHPAGSLLGSLEARLAVLPAGIAVEVGHGQPVLTAEQWFQHLSLDGHPVSSTHRGNWTVWCCLPQP